MYRLNLLFCCFVAAIAAFLPHTAFAAEDVASVLAKIDAAGANIKTISADFEWKTVATQPITDEETQQGTLYFKRARGDSFQMAADVQTENGAPSPKILTYSRGIGTLYEKLSGQFHTFKAGDKENLVDSLLFLGFGTSRNDLTKNFSLKFIRSETLNGINCDVLELTPKDSRMSGSLVKATIWFDVARGVGIKQIFDEGGGARRECLYSHIKINPHLPSDAFRQRD